MVISNGFKSCWFNGTTQSTMQKCRDNPFTLPISYSSFFKGHCTIQTIETAASPFTVQKYSLSKICVCYSDGNATAVHSFSCFVIGY